MRMTTTYDVVKAWCKKWITFQTCQSNLQTDAPVTEVTNFNGPTRWPENFRNSAERILKKRSKTFQGHDNHSMFRAYLEEQLHFKVDSGTYQMELRDYHVNSKM